MENHLLLELKKLKGQVFTNTNSMAGKWLNYTLVSVESGIVEASIPVRPEMTNPNGMLHGGMISMISDELCGLAFYSLGYPTYYTTVNLIIDYLYSAPVHTTVIAKAIVIRSGKRIANIECIIYDQENRIISRATSNLVNTDKEVFKLSISNS